MLIVCKSCFKLLNFLHSFKLKVRKSNCSLEKFMSSKFQLGFIFMVSFNTPK